MQAKQCWSFLVEKNLIHPHTPELVVQLAFEAGNRLFDVAFRHRADGDDTILNEARRMIAAYLQTYAPAPRKRPK